MQEICYRLQTGMYSVSAANDSSPRSREADPETDCSAFPTHHPRIQQEPLSQSRTCAGQRQMVPSDHAVVGLVADDPVPCEPAADVTSSVTTGLGGCSGSSAAAWTPSVRPPAAAYDADDARMHTRRYTLSQKTLLQTCTHTHTHTRMSTIMTYFSSLAVVTSKTIGG